MSCLVGSSTIYLPICMSICSSVYKLFFFTCLEESCMQHTKNWQNYAKFDSLPKTVFTFT